MDLCEPDGGADVGQNLLRARRRVTAERAPLSARLPRAAAAEARARSWRISRAGRRGDQEQRRASNQLAPARDGPAPAREPLHEPPRGVSACSGCPCAAAPQPKRPAPPPLHL